MSGKVVVFNHPLMTHKLAIIRNEKTNTKDFRETVSEIANLMAYEATRDLPVKEVEVKTPIAVSKTTMVILLLFQFFVLVLVWLKVFKD